jgi:hypothetical protein
MDFEGFVQAAVGDINDFMLLVGVVLYLGAFMGIVHTFGTGLKVAFAWASKSFGDDMRA